MTAKEAKEIAISSNIVTREEINDRILYNAKVGKFCIAIDIDGILTAKCQESLKNDGFNLHKNGFGQLLISWK